MGFAGQGVHLWYFYVSSFAVKVSEDFERFLELLGDKIQLKGWQKYRGGLDVKSRSDKCKRFSFVPM